MAMAASVVSPSIGSSKVSVREIFVVRPSQPLNRSTIFLSNIDRTHGYFSRNLFFFRDNPGTQAVVEHLHKALSKLLVAYPGHAGRLVVNPVTNRLEIDCNSAGSLLAFATSHLSIHDASVDDFDDLFLSPAEARSLEDLPLLTVQVTHLGGDNGFAIAILNHHLLDDATSGIFFLLNLASISRGDCLYLAPNFDRTQLRARDPPKVDFEHREFTNVGGSRFAITPDSILAAEKSQREAPRKTRKTYHFSFHRLNELKKVVTHDGLVSRCSSFEALAALVWRAHARALESSSSAETLLKLHFVMDTRNILQPPLGSNFSGNGQFGVVAEMTWEDMCKLPLSHIVLCIQEARKMLTDEYMRSAIDYLELHPDHWHVAGNSQTKINTWPRLMSKAVELDLGWGKPARVEFPLDNRNSAITFFPFDANGNVDGFYVSVKLDPAPVAAFEEHIAALEKECENVISPLSTHPHNQ
ncbi:omega-hydroxypalmitate O-feruloyl transferase [Selaginella moellendorffii]|nr:omega-hydroxypalmitate O-feruloyl transferase [Selaginella moellendorffii]|eukprot:XP_002967261.2 omega-hydroxypalmitate O-feruloyl transferase [Selaginella moellendorffii]